MTTPTKAEELEILRAAAAKLGQNSYLGPWLSGIIPEAEQLIRSDILPEIRIADTARRCEREIAYTNERIKELLTRADTLASKTIADARTTAENIRARIYRQLTTAAQSLIQ